MKKLFLTLCVALLSMGAQAQEKGDFAIGLRGGPTFSKMEIEQFDIKENSTRIGFGAFGQYNLSNHWRTELEGIYHPKKDHVSDFLIGLNFQYLFHVSDNFKIYPQLGYAFQFVNSETYTETYNNSTITVEGDNDTDGGIQMGLGLQYNLGENWFIAADYKWQPGIFADAHVVMASFGYRF